MRLSALFFLLLTGAAAAFAQNPTVTAVENAASNIPPGLPNAGIALGSMFVVKGSNLGPANIAVASSFPLQTTLSDTSVQINIGGRTISAIMYYTLDRQVAAILPSTAIAGQGTLTVTYKTSSSGSFPINIVTSNVAMYTLSSTGSGDAIVTLADNTVVTASNAPNPGDVVVLWANGVGPVTFDETNAAPGGDLSTVPLEAYVGGKQAQVLYRGRNACCSSVDQINIQLPTDVSGCAVPLVLRITNLVSNTTTLPIAATGRTCTPARPDLSLDRLTQLLAKPNLTTGTVLLGKTVVTSSIPVPGSSPITTTTRTDLGSAVFTRYGSSPSAVVSSAIDFPNTGSCMVYSYAGSTVPSNFTFQNLDAGTSLALDGPGGPKSIARSLAGGSTIYNTTLDSKGTYLAAGQYTVNGPGGADVGNFTAQVTPAILTWSNQTSSTSVNRFQGLTITWTGGDPNGYVQISGTSSGGSTPSTAVGATFVCTARVADGRFTVPSVVLLALPASQTVSGVAVPGTLTVSASVSSPFAATGLDLGAILFSNNISQSATYQ